MTSNRRCTRSILLGATALAGALALSATPAGAQERRYDFDVPAQPLNAALQTFARQAQLQVIFAEVETKDLRAPPLSGAYSAEEALGVLLAGTDLKVSRTNKGVFQITASSDPQSGGAAGDGAESGTVDALIVTAQKREEDIQDVPIAISAFTQEQLTDRQVAGGPDLMTQVPNFTFTKTNFSSYSIQIRGIGTQAISATVDPAVAVAFNNTPFTRNRFFEQEFYDLQRVEVLRGPQGTLYGRNATAGVVNIISQKPKFTYEAKLSGDVSNYGSHRLEGMINIPLVEDVAALRLAGAWTKRDGYVTNALSSDPIDGRDLWSTRVSLRVDPTDWMRANLVYEHFEEDDDRLRSGKQLCKRNPNPTHYGSAPLTDDTGEAGVFLTSVYTSQGCEPASLYSPESFQVPNGFALPYYGPLSNLGHFPENLGGDPYVSSTQSRDLRVIESVLEPEYKAKTDIVQLQLAFDIGDGLELVSETAYGIDELFSFQDFNRFNTARGAWSLNPELIATGRLTPDGYFCDPQLGCADRLLAGDLATSKAKQFSQELRLASSFDGPFNFSLGANYLRSDSIDKYYVFINSLTLLSTVVEGGPDWQAHYYVPGEYDGSWCLSNLLTSDPNAQYGGLPFGCKYTDPNPIGSLNDYGRNYFLSKNPYHLVSYALFGEVTYNLTAALKLTAGLRYTVDRKRAPIIPSWLLAENSYGLPAQRVIEQEWREPTGRVVLDWKPDVAFTDETMLYASYAHGYKAGGANPPLPVNLFDTLGSPATTYDAIVATHPPTFAPEFVDAFEVGSKNTLLGGLVTANANLFYYDYEGYQISHIADRTAINTGFDAKVWGAELEVDWRPLENLRLGFKGGYEKTRIADGSSAVDIMDRTAGHTDWAVIKPFPTIPSNCILPVWWLEFMALNSSLGHRLSENPCGSYYSGLDPITYLPYVPDPQVVYGGMVGGIVLPPQPLPDHFAGYPGFNPESAPNGGQGFSKDLSGNELPNAPDFTATITVDYTLPLPRNWLMTLHTDLYYQSEAWTRVFNSEGYDKLKAYSNVNLAAIFTNEDHGWHVMAYVKNVLDRDSITGAFLNSDDTGLTTNVFLTEPRLYGIRVTKNWTGDAPWGAGGPADGPFPVELELGGTVERMDAPNGVYRPDFLADYSSAVHPLAAQQSDLDWGDSRDIRLTYAPGDGPWRVSAAWRFGKANAGHHAAPEEIAFDQCGVSPPLPEDFCDNGYQHYQVSGHNYGIGQVFQREDFTIVDFQVGRDLSFGAASPVRSRLAAGLRYAAFDSLTTGSIRVSGNWEITEQMPYFGTAHHERGLSNFSAERAFDGVGPVIQWDVSAPFAGAQQTGRIGADFSLTGGVLFGDRETHVAWDSVEEQFEHDYWQINWYRPEPIETVTTAPVELRRSASATAPVAGASIGLFYEIQRLRIGAGYRFDRFFEVIDGGFADAEDKDRTIDGPYFKLSVGFGG